MRALFICLLATSIASLALQGQAPAAEDATQPEAPKEEVPITGSKRTVMFPHNKGHENIECVVCHHPVEGKPTWKKCASSGCHDNLTEKKGESSLYFVMHSKSEELKHQSCMSCHVKTVEEKPDLKKRLTGCSGSACHPATKKAAEDDAKSE